MIPINLNENTDTDAAIRLKKLARSELSTAASKYCPIYEMEKENDSDSLEQFTSPV